MSAREPRPARSTGATRGESATRKRKPWWMWLLIALAALIALAILLFALSRCGASATAPSAAPAAATDAPSAAAGATDPSTASPDTATPTPPATPTPSVNDPSAPAAGDAGGGSGGGGGLTAGGISLLPLAQVAGPNGDLSAQVGMPVMAQAAVVLSVPADEGFWIGTDETDRVWVQLSGDGESPYAVTEGDQVTFTGQMIAHDPTFADEIGVDAAEGADQLTAQGAHVTLPMAELR